MTGKYDIILISQIFIKINVITKFSAKYFSKKYHN